MEYKTIQELYLAVGVAGAIIIVFLALFVWIIIRNDKARTEELKQIIDKLSSLQVNDSDFKNLMENLTQTVKELSTTNRVVADTVNRLDFYNKDLSKKLDKHDERSEKILERLGGLRWGLYLMKQQIKNKCLMLDVNFPILNL